MEDCSRCMCVLVAAIGSANLICMVYIYVYVLSNTTFKPAALNSDNALPILKKNVARVPSKQTELIAYPEYKHSPKLPVIHGKKSRRKPLKTFQNISLLHSTKSHGKPLQSKNSSGKSPEAHSNINVKHKRRMNNVNYYKSLLNNRYFSPRVNANDLLRMRNLLKIFDSVMTKYHLTYIIHAGTLLGSYRHHGLVPWDDDIDVMVPLSASKTLYYAFQNIYPEFVLNLDFRVFWKLFSNSAKRIHNFTWKWPFLDIFFYDENKTHIWNIAPKFRKLFVFPKWLVFPVRRRPFMDLLLLAPRNPKAYLAVAYNISMCNSGSWTHKTERGIGNQQVPCYLLYSQYPFVWRTFVNGSCNETLIYNGIVKGLFFDENSSC